MVEINKIIGVDEIKNRLKEANVKLGSSVRKGLIKAGLFLQRESQKIVPIDTTNLKGSAGTEPKGLGWKTNVIVFYTASYAVYVHEITTNRHKKGKYAKFLEKPMREKKEKILQIITAEAEKI